LIQTHAQPKPPRYIELCNGELCEFETATEFDIEAIAHALSMACRFGGQCSEFYSVAQHSIVVAKIMGDMTNCNPFEGIIHDASEAIMLDMPTPIKYMMPDYHALEKDLCARVRVSFGLPPEKSAQCERADKLAMFMEAYGLISSKGATFDDVLGARSQALRLRSKYAIWLKPMDWRTAKNWFLETYRELK
jgi:hypothetical protein